MTLHHDEDSESDIEPQYTTHSVAGISNETHDASLMPVALRLMARRFVIKNIQRIFPFGMNIS